MAGAGGEDEDTGRLGEGRAGPGAEDAVHVDAGVDHRFQRVGDRPRLLVDLLLHVVTVRAQVHGGVGQVAQALRAADGLAGGINHLHAAAADGDHVAVLEVHHAPRLRHDGRDVGGEEVLAVAQPHHERAAHAGAGDRVRILEGDDADGIGATQVGGGLLRGEEDVARRLEVVVHEVGDDLGVGLRLEGVAQRLQAFALLLVVLDDAVVHDGDLVAGDMGVRVGLGDAAVRGPAGVGDADDAGQVLGLGGRFHLRHATHAPHAPDRAIQDGDARGVVPAVFEALQPFREDGHDVATGDGPYDSAHGADFLTKNEALRGETGEGLRQASCSWPHIALPMNGMRRRPVHLEFTLRSHSSRGSSMRHSPDAEYPTVLPLNPGPGPGSGGWAGPGGARTAPMPMPRPPPGAVRIRRRRLPSSSSGRWGSPGPERA